MLIPALFMATPFLIVYINDEYNQGYNYLLEF